MPFEVGQRFGDYEILAMLGVGGMGHVYRVRNVISNRTEAMKVLLPDLTAEPDLATRFISEIRTLASFDHPNIAQLHTALVAENQLIMMMEFVEGYTLEQLAKQRALPIAEVAGYVSQALSALSYTHSRGVVHRDIKPANLMVTSHGIVKLMDFGIAKSQIENNNYTRPGTTIGSLYYMSPEQVRGGAVDGRTDIYSTGIVLYELLAGRRPFEADTTFTILNKQLNEPPQPPIELNPAIPEALNGLILMALAKDPGQRFQNADAFRNALKQYCAPPAGQEAAAAVGVGAAVGATAGVAAAMAAPDGPASATAMLSPAASFAPTSFASPPPAAPYMPPPMQTLAPAAQASADAKRVEPQRSEAPAPKSANRNKTVWIATGAIAAVLALVALGATVPHWMKAHAAGSTASSAAGSVGEPAATAPAATTAPLADNPAATPAAAQAASPQPAGPSPEEMERRKAAKEAEQRKQEEAHLLAQQQAAQAELQAQQAQQAQQEQRERMQAQQHKGTEIDGQVQQRLADIDARATVARRQLAQIRREQAASGVAARGDVEAAGGRLDSDLLAARSDIEAGNTAAAKEDLNKAETELRTVERYLGR